jgi:hypothetical protein
VKKGKQAVLFLKKKNQKNFSPLGARVAPAPVVLKTRSRPELGPQTAEPPRAPKPGEQKFFWFFFFKKRTACLPFLNFFPAKQA